MAEQELNKQREFRLRQFDKAARSTAEAIAKTGLSDEELEIRFEAARKRVHEGSHGRSSKS